MPVLNALLSCSRQNLTSFFYASGFQGDGSSVAVPTHEASTETCSVGVATDPDCLGPCEPGSSVTLEGIIWQETDNGDYRTTRPRGRGRGGEDSLWPSVSTFCVSKAVPLA